MSTKTSHRRRHSRHQRKVAATFANTGYVPVQVDAVVTEPQARTCWGRCTSQCDECHDIDNCVEATHTYGDLLLCGQCRDKHPAVPPWRVDPESGEYVDVVTGKVL